LGCHLRNGTEVAAWQFGLSESRTARAPKHLLAREKHIEEVKAISLVISDETAGAVSFKDGRVQFFSRQSERGLNDRIGGGR
jgi:hypothetical protein